MAVETVPETATHAIVQSAKMDVPAHAVKIKNALLDVQDAKTAQLTAIRAIAHNARMDALAAAVTTNPVR